MIAFCRLLAFETGSAGRACQQSGSRPATGLASGAAASGQISAIRCAQVAARPLQMRRTSWRLPNGLASV